MIIWRGRGGVDREGSWVLCDVVHRTRCDTSACSRWSEGRARIVPGPSLYRFYISPQIRSYSARCRASLSPRCYSSWTNRISSRPLQTDNFVFALSSVPRCPQHDLIVPTATLPIIIPLRALSLPSTSEMNLSCSRPANDRGILLFTPLSTSPAAPRPASSPSVLPVLPGNDPRPTRRLLPTLFGPARVQIRLDRFQRPACGSQFLSILPSSLMHHVQY